MAFAENAGMSIRGFFGRAAGWFGRALATPQRTLTALAVVVGLITGVGATVFAGLIILVERLYFEHLGGALAAWQLQFVLLPLFPASGALLVGLITYFFAPEAAGAGLVSRRAGRAARQGRITASKPLSLESVTWSEYGGGRRRDKWEIQCWCRYTRPGDSP